MISKKYKYPVALTIAGSDSGGGAGIQADLKTFSALGCYGTSVITALTAQNTLGVTGIHSIPPDFVKEQLRAVLTDIRPQAIKIGMVHTPELATAIAEVLTEYKNIPVVLDPVMVATSGARLIEESATNRIISELFPLATIITPNLDEAALLANLPISGVEDMYEAGKAILREGAKGLLLKGGHLPGEQITSLLYINSSEPKVLVSQKVATDNTHGSGCTLSSAIAAFIARGETAETAVELAGEYVYNAILHGADVATGKGFGPLNHFYNPEKLIKNEME
ncbi:bifunctional hydroxymethylpyrimidine kinase/phosphomethylpyrimidine kinase [Flavobacterium psychrotrophum]|uniref:bifunctional hydroxymethylpyrimidine kinase/phosphomethylpyrimidine kinase n=1 Tax=Flavobacterium psychrotrophum TaxID=2294119 RepID=UPI000E3238F4|nr:bifunctional hydroxymethylpyrimidine kinase/phosphomethylpyrimidine kinase [Flavobacterium psychrotrophum]